LNMTLKPLTGREQRISVVGTTGSGKTTLSERLVDCLGVPHVELDALHWGPNWTELDLETFRAKVARIVQRDAWVIDGNYSAVRELVGSVLRRWFGSITACQRSWGGLSGGRFVVVSPGRSFGPATGSACGRKSLLVIRFCFGRFVPVEGAVGSTPGSSPNLQMRTYVSLTCDLPAQPARGLPDWEASKVFPRIAGGIFESAPLRCALPQSSRTSGRCSAPLRSRSGSTSPSLPQRARRGSRGSWPHPWDRRDRSASAPVGV